jgi:signal transduction histidine kinase
MMGSMPGGHRHYADCDASDRTMDGAVLDDHRGRDTGAPPFGFTPRLICVIGQEAGQSFRIRTSLTIVGRGRDADIALAGPEISRRHAAIERRHDALVVRDLGSRNGTFVNGTPVGEHELRAGDRIQFGGGPILVVALDDELVARAMQFQKLESLASLTGGLAHDFKNTLSVIVSNVDLLEREVGSSVSREGREMIDDIRAAARSGLDSVRRLLYFAGRERGPGWKDVDVATLVDQVVTCVRHPLVARHVVADVSVDPSLTVRGDRDELHHAVLNLVVNAQDAMPSGGRLSVSALARAFTRAQAIEAQLPYAGDYVVLSVEDSGSGMDPETLAHVFEPFFTTKPQGTGLGLPTVYGIVRNHGGAVIIDSRRGEGTTVRIVLPARRRPTTIDE